MDLSKTVYDLSESFMLKPRYVTINDNAVTELSQYMLEKGRKEFPVHETEHVFKTILQELTAGAINYCYWYGRYWIRPLECNSAKMYEIVADVMKSFDTNCGPTSEDMVNLRYNKCIEKIIKKLTIHRFPLLEERTRHLKEMLHNNAVRYAWKMAIDANNQGLKSINDHMLDLITQFPGYGSDMFLKRASLFFIQLYRNFGWFAEDLKTTHVPADYQIPKMLEHFRCITYNEYLIKHIVDGKHLPKHSLEECEIRAATVLVMKKLCELTEWNVADVDGYLFLRRGECDHPFHLTTTTDY